MKQTVKQQYAHMLFVLNTALMIAGIVLCLVGKAEAAAGLFAIMATEAWLLSYMDKNLILKKEVNHNV